MPGLFESAEITVRACIPVLICLGDVSFQAPGAGALSLKLGIGTFIETAGPVSDVFSETGRIGVSCQSRTASTTLPRR